MTNSSFMDAIEAFEATTHTKEGIGLDVCTVYKEIKPILTGILPFLKLIPVYVATVASAISALMAALDSFCKVT